MKGPGTPRCEGRCGLPRPRALVRLATMDAKQLKEAFEKHGIRRVKVGGFDVDGVLRGKYVSLDKFWGALDGAFGFCDVVFGWDIADVLYDNAQVTGWHTGYPDAHARLDPSTFRVLPWEPDTAAFLLDFRRPTTARPTPRARARSSAPRPRARRAARLPGASSRCEFEFFIFKETPESLHAKGFREPHAAVARHVRLLVGARGRSTRELMPRHPGRDGAPSASRSRACTPRPGPASTRSPSATTRPCASADKAALFKSAMKQIAATLRATCVTFMAKWNAELPGSSGHLHQSLWQGGENAFYDAGDPRAAERDGAALPRRPARADARADGALLADHQQLQALRARRLGAAHRDAGASRTGRAPSAPSPAGRRRRASSTGRPPPTSTRTSPWPRASLPASRASQKRDAAVAGARATPADGATSRPCRARSARRPTVWPQRARARPSSARPSSTTTCARATGRCGSTSAP